MQGTEQGWMSERTESKGKNRPNKQTKKNSLPHLRLWQTDTDDGRVKSWKRGMGWKMEKDGRKKRGWMKEDEEADEAKKTRGSITACLGLPDWLFVESHLPLLCSKHHPYLMRPLQSPGKIDAGNFFCPPLHSHFFYLRYPHCSNSHPSVLFSFIISSHCFLLSFSVFLNLSLQITCYF